MLIRARVHPFPSRTRKLSSLLPTILGWRRPGKIGSANMERSHSIEWLLFLLFWRKGYSAGYPFWLDKIYWFIFRYDPLNWIQWGSWKYVTNRSDIQIKNSWVYSTGCSMKILVFYVDKQYFNMVISCVWELDVNSLSGEMAERLKAPVLKTGDVKASVGSNPTLSANWIFPSTCGSTQEAEGAPLLRE